MYGNLGLASAPAHTRLEQLSTPPNIDVELPRRVAHGTHGNVPRLTVPVGPLAVNSNDLLGGVSRSPSDYRHVASQLGGALLTMGSSPPASRRSAFRIAQLSGRAADHLAATGPLGPSAHHDGALHRRGPLQRQTFTSSPPSLQLGCCPPTQLRSPNFGSPSYSSINRAALTVAPADATVGSIVGTVRLT